MENHDLGISHREMSSQIICLAWAFKSSSPSVPPSSHNEFKNEFLFSFNEGYGGRYVEFGVLGWFVFCLLQRGLFLLQKED